MQPVSRAYHKLKFALEEFGLDLKEQICADFGSSTGGFVQAILEQNPKRVYSIETSKNRLHFVLKDDSRVKVMDEQNAIHIELPEKVDFVSIDVGWTPQKLIIPNAAKSIRDSGKIISLIKPHYEAKNKSPSDEEVKEILEQVQKEVSEFVKVLKIIESPIVGKKAGNKEYLMLCEKKVKES